MKLVWSLVLPWDKVGVIRGEGDIKNPGSMSAQCPRQVGVLPGKQTSLEKLPPYSLQIKFLNLKSQIWQTEQLAELTRRIFWCSRRRRLWRGAGSQGRKWVTWWAWRDLERQEAVTLMWLNSIWTTAVSAKYSSWNHLCNCLKHPAGPEL